MTALVEPVFEVVFTSKPPILKRRRGLAEHYPAVAEADPFDPGAPFSDAFRRRMVQGGHRGVAIIQAEKVERDLYRLEMEQIKVMHDLIEQARRDTIVALSKATKDWQIKDRQAVLDSLNSVMNRFDAQATAALRAGQEGAWAQGEGLVDRVGQATGMSMSSLPHIDPRVLAVAMQSTPELITNVSDEVRRKIATQIRLAALGQKSPLELMREMGTTAGKGPWATAFARGEAIYRTEIGRMFQMANAAKMNALAARDASWMKEWRSVHDSRTRPSHVRADGQRVKVTDEFEVGDVKMAYPLDPRAPARETVHCRCIAIPVRPEWDDLSKPRPPVEEDRLRSTIDAQANAIQQGISRWWQTYVDIFERLGREGKTGWSQGIAASNQTDLALKTTTNLISNDAVKTGRDAFAALEKMIRGLPAEEQRAWIARLEALRASYLAESDALKKRIDDLQSTLQGPLSPELKGLHSLRSFYADMAQTAYLARYRIEKELRILIPIGERVAPRPTRESLGYGGKKLAEMQRAYDEILALAKELDGLGLATRWTGRNTYGGAGRAAGTYGYDDSMNINPVVFGYTDASRAKVYLHELLHGTSSAGPGEYARWRGWEEGVVEMTAHEVLERLGRPQGYWSYAQYTKPLEIIRDFVGVDRWEFYTTLIKMPVQDRLAWCEEKIRARYDGKALQNALLGLQTQNKALLRGK